MHERCLRGRAESKVIVLLTDDRNNRGAVDPATAAHRRAMDPGQWTGPPATESNTTSTTNVKTRLRRSCEIVGAL